MLSKLVFVVMVPWHSVLGFQNSQEQWGNYAYRHPVSVISEGLAPQSLPKDLVIDSPDYWRLQEEQAVLQVRQMHASGMDGMLFDLIPRPRFYKEELYRQDDIRTHPLEFFKLFGVWLRAAQTVSSKFKVGVYLESVQRTAEEPRGRTPSAKEWAAMLERLISVYGEHPNLLKMDGKPCIVNFGTNDTRLAGSNPTDWSGGWKEVLGKLAAHGHPLFFVSDVRPRTERSGLLSNWVTLSGAVHMFAPGAPLSFGTGYQEKVAGLVQALGRQYWWSVYPGYYRTERDYSPPDFRRIHELWMAAIRSHVNVVQILTWNDLGERHDIWPSEVNGFVLLQLMSFYSQWFKIGHMPSLSKDKVFFACPAQINNNIRAATSGLPGYAADAPHHDSCFYWAAARQGGSLEISIEPADVITLPKGVSFGVLGPVRRSGPLRLHVRRGGKEYATTTREILDGRRGQEQLAYFYVDASPPADGN